MSELQDVRLYIGNISSTLYDSISSLTVRFEKFGKITSPIELKSKETYANEKYFGHVNMEISNDNLKQLFASLNKVKFMNSSLIVERAIPSFEQNQNALHTDPKLRLKEAKSQRHIEEQLAKQKMVYYRTKTGLAKDKPKRLHDYFDVVDGCLRRTDRVKESRKRLQVDDISYRVRLTTYNNSTKQYLSKLRIMKSGYRQKLWGYDKIKHRNDLVFKYVKGVWKDGNNHQVEALKGLEGVNNDAAVSEKEKKKTESVLNNFLSNYDFDKPIDFEFDQDRREKLESQKDHYDYEAEQNVVVFNEDDDENDENEVDQREEKADLKEILNPHTQEDERVKYDDGKVEFAFNLDESDIEDVQQVNETEAPIVVHSIPEEIEEPETNTYERALFFPHYDSPFLVAQTQLSRLVPFNKNHEAFVKWTSEFDDTRVELMKQFRKRKRDFLRQKGH